MKFITYRSGNKYTLYSKRSLITGEDVQLLGQYEEIMKDYGIDSFDELKDLLAAGKKSKVLSNKKANILSANNTAEEEESTESVEQSAKQVDNIAEKRIRRKINNIEKAEEK